MVDRIDAITRQLNTLIQKQLDTLEGENLPNMSEAELRDYDFRFVRIQALCQDLAREEGLQAHPAAGA
jgi:hypothetical protein